MQILEVEIRTPDLPGARAFYAGVLGFPVAEEQDGSATFSVGASALTLRAGKTSGVYHLAFNIPENCFSEARDWAMSRFPLLPDPDGNTAFRFESWDADALYFTDPDGNILELIARHTLPGSRREGFEILSISEVALATDDVRALAEELGLPRYQDGDENFQAVGDEEGLFILVRAGRLWFPDRTLPAVSLPTVVAFEDDGTRRTLNRQ